MLLHIGGAITWWAYKWEGKGCGLISDILRYTLYISPVEKLSDKLYYDWLSCARGKPRERARTATTWGPLYLLELVGRASQFVKDMSLFFRDFYLDRSIRRNHPSF